MMRLQSVQASGFRAFTKEHEFDLDADVVILAGPNGSGKTSFFDSILWALTGHFPRFGDRKTDAISLFSPSGTARVELQFLGGGGERFEVTRTASDERRAQVLVIDDAERVEGSAAELRIVEKFWPSALQTQDPSTAFSLAFTRSVYLQQDLVREFIETDSGETRFQVISELVAAGRLNEFLRELESSRNAWSRAKAPLERDALDAFAKISQVSARLERLQDSTAPADELAALWIHWWADAREVGVATENPALDAGDAPHLVNATLSVVQAERRTAERLRLLAVQLRERWTARTEKPETDPSEIESLREEFSRAGEEAGRLRAALQEAQGRAATERERLTRLQEREAELVSLAALALRHLDEHCPVCMQEYDVEATRTRLQAQVDRAPEDQRPAILDQVDDLATQLAAAESKLQEAGERLRLAEQTAAEHQRWRSELAVALGDLQLPEDATLHSVESAEANLTQRAATLSSLYTRGEALALAVARASEVVQRAELEQQLETAKATHAERERALAAHVRTGDAATAILDASRSAAQETVDARVQRMEPLVKRIYARMDPHPAFTNLQLATSYPRGRGHVEAVVGDPLTGLADKDPYTLFSSSQLNALAVSIFLGLNLGTHGAPLQLAMMDDPLQSLDDVNLLGLIDTLRRTKALRQLIVSTHDTRLTQLLQRKLRPVGDDRATRVFSFADWSSEDGPNIVAGDVPREPEDYRVAAA